MNRDETRFGGLLDAEERRRADPDSFSIPRSDVRRSLVRGDLAKLLWAGAGDPPAAERMWVEALESDAGRHLGRLDNEPQAISDRQLGARVRFGPARPAARPRA